MTRDTGWVRGRELDLSFPQSRGSSPKWVRAAWSGRPAQEPQAGPNTHVLTRSSFPWRCWEGVGFQHLRAKKVPVYTGRWTELPPVPVQRWRWGAGEAALETPGSEQEGAGRRACIHTQRHQVAGRPAGGDLRRGQDPRLRPQRGLNGGGGGRRLEGHTAVGRRGREASLPEPRLATSPGGMGLCSHKPGGQGASQTAAGSASLGRWGGGLAAVQLA